ncbi:MAG: hypothetical protein R3C19_05380 [Planctomycetaceae bacterium]
MPDRFCCLPAAVRGTLVLLFALQVIFAAIGCSKDDEQHVHEPGTHGGIIVSVGQDHYHAEALFSEGKLRLYMLDQDQAKVIDIEQQELQAFLRPFGDAQSYPITLIPEPQEGDGPDRTSLFVGTLPSGMKAGQLLVNVPMIRINGERYRFSFATAEPVMPAKVTSDAERQLYLTPGGRYTDADIAANGSVTASEKFADFVSSHDMHPEPGARICPITNTVANPDCGWIIGGQEYLFCCPPCVDEFLKRAKEEPESVLDAAAYVK